MELTMKQVQHNLKDAQDRKKRYADLKRTPTDFEIGEHVYMKVKPKKISLRLGKYSNLAPRYCGTFEILAKVGRVAYQLALPPNIKVHNMFQISILKIYVHDVSHVIDWNVIQWNPKESSKCDQSAFLTGDKFYSGTIPSDKSSCNVSTLVWKKLLGR